MFDSEGSRRLEELRAAMCVSDDLSLLDALDSAGTLLLEFAGSDVGGLGSGGSMLAARKVQRLKSLVALGEAHVNAELDAHKTTFLEDGLSTDRWLAQEPRQRGSGCKRRVGVANMFTLKARHASVLFVATTATYLIVVLPLVLWWFGR